MAASSLTGIIVIEIAGLARAGVAEIRPMALATARASSQPSTTRTGVWQPALVPGSVEFGTEGFNPLTAEPSIPTLSFQVVMDDTQWPEVSSYFLAPRNARNHVATLTRGSGGLSSDSAVFQATSLSGADLDVLMPQYTVVYIGRQARRVALAAGSGAGAISSYPQIPDPSDPTTDSTLAADGAPGVLGQFGTFLDDLPARPSSGEVPPVNEDRIYLANPVVRGREVTVYWFDGTGPERVIGRYIIDGDPDVDGRTLTVRAVSVLQALKTTKINRDPIAYTVGAITGGTQRPIVALKPADTESYADRTLRVRPGYYDSMAMQIDRYAFAVSGNGQMAPSSTSNMVGRIDLVSQWGSDAPPEASRLLRATAYELLVSDPLDSLSLCIPLDGPLDAQYHPLYSTERPSRDADGSTDPGVLDHPLWIVLALMGAIDSNLPPAWTAGIPPSYVDVQGVIDLSFRTYAWIDQWPGMVLGKDGKPVSAWDAIVEILRGIGCGLAMTPTWGDAEGGLITVRSMVANAASIRDTITTADVMDGRPISMDTAVTSSGVRVDTGIGFDGAARYPFLVDEAYDTSWDPYVSEAYTMTATGLIHPDDAGGVTVRDEDRVVGLRSLWQSLASLFRYPLMVATIDVPITVQVGAGDFVPLSVKGLPDTSTGQIGDASPALGLCLTRTPMMHGEDAGWQKLKIMLMPYLVTRIGPAAIVTDVTDADTLEFEIRYVEPLDGDGRYVYDGSSYVVRDVEQFEAGMVVQIRSDHHEPAAGTLTIASVDAPNNRVTFTTNHGIGSATGQIMTLADYGDCREDDQAIYAYGDRSEYTL